MSIKSLNMGTSIITNTFIYSHRCIWSWIQNGIWPFDAHPGQDDPQLWPSTQCWSHGVQENLLAAQSLIHLLSFIPLSLHPSHSHRMASKEGTLSFMWSWTFIVTKATSGSHEVSFNTSPDCSSSYTSCEYITFYSLWSCSFIEFPPSLLLFHVHVMSWPSVPFGNLGSHLNRLAPLR